MVSLILSWAFTLAGLIIDSKTSLLFIAVIFTALGAFGSWFWNIRRDLGKISMLFTELPHVALWIIYKVFPDVGNAITYYILIALAIVVLIVFFSFADFDSSGSSSSGSGQRGETDLSDMPGEIFSGNTCYRMVGNYGWGVKYANQNNSSDEITITNVYSRGGGSMSTNAGSFFY